MDCDRDVDIYDFGSGAVLVMDGRLTYTSGIHPPPGPSSPWWYHRALAQGPRFQVQLRQERLPQVLRAFSLCPAGSANRGYVLINQQARLPPRATNCRKRKCGHSNQLRPKKKLK